MTYNILIVCSANKGRSPSYHAHMKHILRERRIDNIDIDSAGVNFPVIEAFQRDDDTGADPLITHILNRQGILEIITHQIKPVDEELLDNSNLVLAYNTEIKNKIMDLFFRHDNIYTVRGFITGKEDDLPSETLDVDDAYHPKGKLYRGKFEPRTAKAYAKVCDESRRLAEKTLEKLLKKLKKI